MATVNPYFEPEKANLSQGVWTNMALLLKFFLDRRWFEICGRPTRGLKNGHLWSKPREKRPPKMGARLPLRAQKYSADPSQCYYKRTCSVSRLTRTILGCLSCSGPKSFAGRAEWYNWDAGWYPERRETGKGKRENLKYQKALNIWWG